MVRVILKLKTDNGLGENNPTFKDIEITEYSFKSPLMGIPTLTAELPWPSCLDNEWTHKEYVEIRGEKYYIRQVQTSEISNNNVVKYKHSLDFKSEREQLLHVYFYDVVPSDILLSNSSGHDKPNTNSTRFKIYATPREFCDRLNCAFRYAGIGDSILETKTSLTDADTPVGDGYCVVLSGYGDGDLEQSQEFEWEDKYLFDALSEGFGKFKIPFAFHGKKIVFNEYVEPISHVFKYGFDNALLSVKKNNANARIINRITFKGSSENIPYHYPNETEYGHIQLAALDSNKILTADNFSLIKPSRLVGKIMSKSPIVLKLRGSADATLQELLYDDNSGVGYRQLVQGEWHKIEDFTSIDEYHGYSYRISFTTEFAGDVVLSEVIGQTWNINDASPADDRSNRASNLIGQDYLRIIGLKNSSGTDFTDCANKDGGRIVMAELPSGSYILELNISWVYNEQSYWWRINSVAFENKNVRELYWQCGDNRTSNLSAWGVEFVGEISESMVGDGVQWDASGRMPFQENLMPPKYRATLGAERFYNALNDTYLKQDGKTYYTFKNPYVDGNPNEYIHVDETIKPTIEGIENSKKELFGVISDIAFDVDDNDSLKSDVGSDEKDKNDSANYAHSFFYIRLNKFDGEYGFDLFKSASQTDPMTIQMTSGKCNGCKFKIQVVEIVEDGVETWSNPVQTLAADGTIVNGTQSQIINKDNPQTWQQDTTKNYIWIAVQKDAGTFGVIMPNRTHEYLPAVGDTFNIINIDLPHGYITAAEERGMYAMLDFMEDNNEEKFNFDITMSRIFFEEHPEILASLNENSRIKIEYDGKLYEQYVSEFAIDCKNNEVLPDVKLTLADALESSGSFVDEVVAQAVDATNIGRGGRGTGGGLSTDLADKRYVRKDKDDRTEHRISSDTAFEVGNFVSGSRGGIIFVDPETGQSTIEVDYIKARIKAIFETLEIAHVRSIGGKLTITPGGSINISFVEELDDAYRCYFKRQEDTEGADCRFIVGDDVICQSFNISNGSHQNASNKYYWRKVTAVSNEGAYVELSKTDCATGSDIPEIGDTICQLGSDDVSRQSAIILSTVDTFSPNITLYDGVTDFTLNGKEMVDMGVDQTTNKAYFHVYGDAYIGDKEGNSYAKYNNLLKELEVKAKLNIASTVGDKPIDEYIGEVADTKLEGYSYLKKALRDVTSINGGLMLTGLIRLGENNTDPNAQTVWAGHNGIYGNGRTIGSWWGGDMLDLFKGDDTRKTIGELKEEAETASPRGATALIRMDGSAYFSNGNIGFKKDGSGWLGNDLTGIKFESDGTMTLGSGITINITNDEGIKQTLKDVINFNIGLTSLLKPYDKNGAPLSWSEAIESDGFGGVKAKSLRASVSLASKGDIVAYQTGGLQGGGGGGLDISALEQYLTDNNYATHEWVSAHFNNYKLTKSDVEAVLTGDISTHTHSQYLSSADLTSYITKNDADDSYVSNIGTLGNSLTWAKGGAINSFIVPYASNSGTLGGISQNGFIKYSGGATLEWAYGYNLTHILGFDENNNKKMRVYNANVVRDFLSVYSKSEVDTKLTNGSVTRVGTQTVGSYNLPVYLYNGLVTQVSSISESYLSWGTKGMSGRISPLEISCLSDLSTNRLAFSKADGIVIEYSRDGGNSWLEYPATPAHKVALVSGIGANLYVGASASGVTNEYGLRVTLNATDMGLHVVTRKLLLHISTHGASGCSVLLETAHNDDKTLFSEVAVYDISGYDGWNSIPLSLYFGGNVSTHIGSVRLTFFSDDVASGGYSALELLNIVAIGEFTFSTPSVIAKTGHLYNYDINQNALFPSNIYTKGLCVSSEQNVTVPDNGAYVKGDVSTDGDIHVGGGTISWDGDNNTFVFSHTVTSVGDIVAYKN